MKKSIVIIALFVAAGAIAAAFIFTGPVENDEIVITPEIGEFKSTVTVSGELRAKNSIDIRGPENARAIGIWQMKISKLIDEGTVVKEGEFVAEIDKTEVSQAISNIQLNIDQINSQLEQLKLDSTLTLSAARDELENLKFSMEEKKLLMEQSKFEAPAIIRQAEIDYERVKRQYAQAQKNYKTKVLQAEAQLREKGTELAKEQQSLQRRVEAMQQFTILAPADGMVIYDREWNGRRKIVGSMISAWDPIVATLPDLTEMESVTYVNEVDIQKIREGQPVKIGLDANPDKKLSGEVVKVANIGEQKRNSDSKVFEVIIKVNEKDTTLLPAMTTSNEIVVETLEDVLYIPLEAIHTETPEEGEKISFVYLKDNGGFTRQEIEIKTMNDTHAVIERGINSESELYLSIPTAEEMPDISLLPKKKEKKKPKEPEKKEEKDSTEKSNPAIPFEIPTEIIKSDD
jgi:multidrug efflux pump subunit AcrA (membrane-fusion protein)